MSNPLEIAGAQSAPSDFAPIHVNRMMTGLWTNTNPLRDAASSLYEEKFYGGRQDSFIEGINGEISSKLTYRRRYGHSVYNSQIFPPIKRFYSFNTFSLTNESVRVMADTATTVYDATGPNTQTAIWQKSPGAGSTYFLGVGNTLFFTNGVDNKQWVYDPDTGTGPIFDWGVDAPPAAPTVTQMPRPNNYALWQASTVYGISNPARSGVIILDDSTAVNPGPYAIIPLQGGGNLAIGCGMNLLPGASVPLPSGFTNTQVAVWCTPGNGFLSQTLSGVYASNGSGGTVTTSFQNRSGANAGAVNSNWIAVAWDAAAASHISVVNSGGFRTITVTTANGDSLALIVGFGYRQSTIPVPGGFDTAHMLSITGMVSADNTSHGMQGVLSTNTNYGGTPGEIDAAYADGSGNLWYGNAGVFAVFYKAGQGTSIQSVTNGTTLTVPIGGSNNAVLTFTNSLQNNTTFGLPSGYNTTNTNITAAITGLTKSGSNISQGWFCNVNGTTIQAYYRDGSGNQWDAYATAFAVGSTSVGMSGNLQWYGGNGTTGAAEPSSWGNTPGAVTQDGSVSWVCLGSWQWQAGHNYALGDVVVGAVASPAGMPNQIYVATTPGQSGGTQPQWPGGPNLQIQDGSVTWTCEGRIMGWADIGASTNITPTNIILDPNGYLQQVARAGKSGTAEPTFGTELGALTDDGTMRWNNIGSYSAGATAGVQYGYAFQNPTTGDISEMSPASATIQVLQGNQITVQGQGSGQAGASNIIIYRTAQDGSTFLYLDTIPNPGAGQTWTYIDNSTDADLNTEQQAQVNGEGTPLPAGATCLAYHVGRIFVGVGNVVYVSSGPDAVVAASSGNAGFDITFTAQSKIVRFWVNSIGVVVFTVRDSYIILGSGTDSDPLYMVTYIANIPLLSYDCLAIFLTNAYLLTGNKLVGMLDPSSGIVESSFPIADQIRDEIDPTNGYVTFMTGASGETAMYVSNGADRWFRMSPTSTPEIGINWSTRALITGGMSAVQAVETSPGVNQLLLGPPPAGGPILVRDTTTYADNGNPYRMTGNLGSIVLANPGQLAGLAWVTIESSKAGTAPLLSVILDEVYTANETGYEPIRRTRQDPPNLPPSDSVLSNRHSLLQGQNPVWCRHMRMFFDWGNNEGPDELYTYTIFGQVWKEQRSQ